MSITTDYNKLLKEKQTLEVNVQVATKSMEQAQKEYDAAHAKILTKYKVNSVEELQAILKAKEQELETVVSGIKSQYPELLK